MQKMMDDFTSQELSQVLGSYLVVDSIFNFIVD